MSLKKLGRFFQLLIAVFVLVAGLALAQSPPAGISAQENAAVQTIARYVAGSSDRTTTYLQELGFSPVSSSWAGFSTYDKIAVAWEAAGGRSDGSGTRFLAMLARRIAQIEGGAILQQPNLVDILNTPDGELSFSAGPEVVPINLPANVQTAIRIIAEFAAGQRLGTVHHIVEHYFLVPPAEARRIVASASTPAGAFALALSRQPNRSSRTAILRTLVAAVDNAYPAARAETTLDPYRNQSRQSIGPPSPAPGTPPFDPSAPNVAIVPLPPIVYPPTGWHDLHINGSPGSLTSDAEITVRPIIYVDPNRRQLLAGFSVIPAGSTNRSVPAGTVLVPSTASDSGGRYQRLVLASDLQPGGTSLAFCIDGPGAIPTSGRAYRISSAVVDSNVVAAMSGSSDTVPSEELLRRQSAVWNARESNPPLH